MFSSYAALNSAISRETLVSRKKKKKKKKKKMKKKKILPMRTSLSPLLHFSLKTNI